MRLPVFQDRLSSRRCSSLRYLSHFHGQSTKSEISLTVVSLYRCFQPFNITKATTPPFLEASPPESLCWPHNEDEEMVATAAGRQASQGGRRDRGGPEAVRGRAEHTAGPVRAALCRGPAEPGHAGEEPLWPEPRSARPPKGRPQFSPQRHGGGRAARPWRAVELPKSAQEAVQAHSR